MKYEVNGINVPEEILSYDEIKIEMKMKDNVLKVGHPADVREKIEDMICEKLGFYPSLQEDVDDGEYQVYLHTDSYDDLDEDQIIQLEKLSITDDPETSTEGIKRFLQVEFRFVTEAL
jgi:hypothetical protein